MIRKLLLALFIPLMTNAQEIKSFSKYITAADLRKHLFIIAGPEMEGRNTLSRGERRAAAYISRHFQENGLTPGNNQSYLMPFPLQRDSVVHAEVSVNDDIFTLNKDFNVQMPSYSSTMMFSHAIFIGENELDSSNNMSMMGALVIVSAETSFGKAYQQNPAAIVYVKKDQDIILDQENSMLGSPPYNYRISPPVFFVSETVAMKMTNGNYHALLDSSRKRTFIPVSLQANIKLSVEKGSDTAYANNVVGVIEGTDKKDEYLIITAHYDHQGRDGKNIFYGADDDGSGTVAILELAEAFAKAKAAGKGPRRSIVFMTVSGEEKGLLGSSYYSEHPLFPLDKTTANLNIDMIGRIDPKYKGDSLNYIYAIGEHKLSSDLQPITDAANKKCCRMQIDRKFNDPKDRNRFYYRSDHYNFAKKGVPIIFYFNGTHADYHEITDTPDKINYSLMEKRARLIFYTAWEMANRNDMLKRDKAL